MTFCPQFFRVRQHLPRPRIDDIPAEVERQLSTLNLAQKIKPGQSVAVTVGSRGIANIRFIIKAAVDHLKQLGAAPFMVPAMGSHGGGTAEGQREIVEGYLCTEALVGCPIRASMETVIVCETAEGIPVHFDKHAYDADHVLVVGRIKPHTNFVGDIESGLMKMMLIGLGKHAGAKIYHRAINDYSFGQIVRSVAGRVLEQCGIVAGLGIVENGYDETALLAAVHPDQFESREKELLRQAKEWMPKLPFSKAELLIIEEFGKNISGSGMDTNVVGRKFLNHQAAEDEFPKIKRIWIRGLTEDTHGNAAGIGGAEYCSQKVLDQIDLKITRINCITGGSPVGAMLPVSYDTEKEILESALSTVGLVTPENSGIMWIQNTLQVAEVECSACYLEEARDRKDLEVISELRDLAWNEQGNLAPLKRPQAPHA